MDEISPLPQFCYSCRNPFPPDAFFCPHCGKQLKQPPLSKSIFTLVWIFFVSIFLPPLGLWPGIKYAKHSDPLTRRIGIIVIALTILSSVISIWLTFVLANIYVSTITGISNL